MGLLSIFLSMPSPAAHLRGISSQPASNLDYLQCKATKICAESPQLFVTLVFFAVNSAIRSKAKLLVANAGIRDYFRRLIV
jgi:hypothetical protein